MSSLSTLPKGDSAWLLRKAIERIIDQVSVLETNIGVSTSGNSANTQIIFNDNGTLRGDPDLTFNTALNKLVATNLESTTALVVGTTATITGDLTAARLIVTGGTIPTNGLWLATTNTLEFAANSLAQYRIAPLGVFSWFDGAGGTRMTLNSTGLGVGVAPSAGKFEVLETGTGSGLGGIFASTATAGGNPGFVFRTASTNRWSISLTGTAGAESIRFYDVNAAATRLTLDSSGNVGIGVTPSAFGVNFKAIEIGGSGTSLFSGSGATPQTYLTSNAYFNGTSWIYKVSNSSMRYEQGSGGHLFYTAPSGTAGNAITFTQAMTLDASGNLLVGTTSQILSGKVSLQTAGTRGYSYNDNTGTAGTKAIIFGSLGVEVGNIAITTLATTFNSISDYRLKEAVQPLVGGLARVSALKPSIYKWKVNGSDGEGFLAHELASVVSAAVTGEKDAVNEDGSIKAQSIDMSRIVPILVAAIQELTARVQTLEAR